MAKGQIRIHLPYRRPGSVLLITFWLCYNVAMAHGAVPEHRADDGCLPPSNISFEMRKD